MEGRCESCGRPLSEAELAFGVTRCAQCAEVRAEAIPDTVVVPSPDPAGFGTRVGAYIIDYIFAGIAGLVPAFALGILTFVITTLLSGDVVSQREDDRNFNSAIAVGAIAYGFAQIAYVWLGNAFGGTAGKRLLNLRVLDDNDRNIGLGRGFLRFLVWTLGTFPLYLGWLWALWDDDGQAWHDKAAGSFVLQRPSGQAWGPASKEGQPFYQKPWALGLGAAAVLGIVIIVAGIIILRSLDVTYENESMALEDITFEVGDCVVYVADTIEKTASCSEPYDAVVVEAVDMSGGDSYPGEQEIVEFGDGACPSETDIYYFPTPLTWAAGDRQIVCLQE